MFCESSTSWSSRARSAWISGRRLRRLRFDPEERGFVDVVELLGRQVRLAVFSIELAAHEEVENVRVEMVVALHEAHDAHRLAERFRLLVRAIARGERFEDVCHGH